MQHAAFALFLIFILTFILDGLIFDQIISNWLFKHAPIPTFTVIAIFSARLSYREYRSYKSTGKIGLWEFYLIARLAAGALFCIFAAAMTLHMQYGY